MNNLIHSWLHMMRLLMLLSTTVLLLGACGNPEKTDLLAIAQALKDTGYSEEANRQYQQRLAAAQSEQEAETILNEMLAIFEKVPPALNGLDLQTDQGRSIRDDLSQGLTKIIVNSRKIMTLSSNDTAQLMAVQQELNAGQQQMLAGQNKFMHAAGKHGLAAPQ